MKKAISNVFKGITNNNITNTTTQKNQTQDSGDISYYSFLTASTLFVWVYFKNIIISLFII